MTFDRTVYSLLLKQETGQQHSYCHMFFLIAFLEAAFIRNIILIICFNYIICINDNSVINNFHGKL